MCRESSEADGTLYIQARMHIGSHTPGIDAGRVQYVWVWYGLHLCTTLILQDPKLTLTPLDSSTTCQMRSYTLFKPLPWVWLESTEP